MNRISAIDGAAFAGPHPSLPGLRRREGRAWGSLLHTARGFVTRCDTICADAIRPAIQQTLGRFAATEASLLQWHCLSQYFRNSRVLQSNVGPNSRFDLVIDHEPTIADWAVPDFMVALALSNERATMIAENGFDPWRVILRH